MKRRWLKIGAGLGIGIITILGFFQLLAVLYGFQITDLTGDIYCEGTFENPCISRFDVRNPNAYYVDIYNKNQTKLDFSPEIEDYALFVKDGRCSATGVCRCELKDGKLIGFDGWRCVDFTNKTKPRKDKVYVFRFPAYTTKHFMLAGIKKNPSDTIKWGFGIADEFLDPVWYGEDRDIGYEFLDDGNVVHIWNTQDDYFFDKNSGIQFTNYYEDYWSKNIFCLGYYSGEEWIKIKCADELSNFNRNIQTDNLTYVNATLWKDFSYSYYDLRLGVRYHLGLDDKNLSVSIYGKNIGIDIPYDLGFAWKVKNLDVPPETTDKILINNTNYGLDGNYDLLFKDMKKIIQRYNIIGYENVTNETGNFTIPIYEVINETVKIPFYKIYDYDGGLTGKENFLRIDWNEDLNYAVKMYGNGNQNDFYTALLINAGHFNSGQEKSTTFYWIDALIDNLIAYYKLDENAANTDVEDSHGANEGTASTNTANLYNASGKINSAFDFDGSSEYVETSSFSADATANSYSFWVNFDTIDSVKYILRHADYTFGTTDRAVNIGWYNNYLRLFCQFFDSSGAEYGRYVQDWIPTIGVWYHIVIVMTDTGDENIKFYINGNLQESTLYNDQNPSGITTTSYPLQIGRMRSALDRYFDGRIDEVAIWKGVALNLTDAQALYNEGNGFAYPFGIDTTPPTYSNNQTNNTNAGQSTLFSILYNDNLALESDGQYIFSTNNTGTWANESAVNFTATPQWANVTKTLNSTVGLTIGYRWYADDNQENINNTPIYTLTTVDTIFPVVTLNTPVDYYNSSSSSITFNGTASDNLDLANVSLYGNWTGSWILNETNSSPVNNIPVIFTKTISDGLGYIWNYYACDSSNNCNFSVANRTFNIDTTPNIQFEYPTPVNEYNSSANHFIANVSLTETYFDNLTFYLYNSTDIVDTTTYTNSTRHINWTGLSDDKYSYNATVWTNTSQSNSTETRNITIDTIAPIINVYSPTNSSYTTSTIYFNASADETIDTWIVNYNSTNVTHTINTSLTVEEGFHHLFLYGNDSFGNFGLNDTIYFSVDGTNPSISYNPTTTEAGYQSQDYIFVNITCSDLNKDTVVFNWNTTNESFDNSDGDIYWENQTSLVEGNYTFYAWCNDTFGNSNQTSTRSVALDTTIPDVVITSPENITYDTSNIDFNVSVSADTELCKFTIDDWVTNYTMTEFNNTYFNYTNSSMIDNQHTSKFWCNDSAGNINDTELVTFTVDTTYPLLNITYPANNSYLDTTWINITGTASDTNPDTISINDTNFGANLGTYTNWNFTNTSISEGSYSIQVSANDTANNTNSSVLNFVIDRTNPSIYYNPNTDSGYVSRDWILVNVTATDTNLHSVRLEWNGTNETFDNSGNDIYWENQTSLVEGNYTFYAWANDSVGRYNQTSTRNVAVDTTAPLVNMTYPLNITYDYPNPIYLNYTASDAGIGLDSCWYSTNGGITNTTITCGINATDLIVEEDSSNTWTIWVNDSFGHENSSTITFYSKSPYLDFNISITTNTTLSFYPDNNTHIAVAAVNQTDSIGVFTANNNHTVAINISVKLNETNPKITLKLGNSSNYSLSIAITTSYQIIYRNLTVDSTEYLWAWADYNQTTKAWYPELGIRGINTTYSGG